MSIGRSVRESALRAVVAALGDSESPAQQVYRSKLDQYEQAQLPCYDVRPGDEKVTESDHDSVQRALTVTVRAVIDASLQGDSDGQPEAADDDSGLDPFYVFAVQQLAGGFANLGGVVLEVREVGTKTVFRPEGRDLIGLEMNFELTFDTQRGDPATGA